MARKPTGDEPVSETGGLAVPGVEARIQLQQRLLHGDLLVFSKVRPLNHFINRS